MNKSDLSEDCSGFMSAETDDGFDRVGDSALVERAGRRRFVASFLASDASFCISDVFSTAGGDASDERCGAVEFNDVVRRGGSGAPSVLVVDSLRLYPAGVTDGNSRRSFAVVEYW